MLFVTMLWLTMKKKYIRPTKHVFPEKEIIFLITINHTFALFLMLMLKFFLIRIALFGAVLVIFNSPMIM